MDLDLLKQIVNSSLPDEVKEHKIIGVLAADENALPEMMKVLESERRVKRELITDMNVELSRAHVFIDLKIIENLPKHKNGHSEGFTKGFVMDEIEKFYTKYKSLVTHCFNRFND